MGSREKVTLETLREFKRTGRKISVLTCYDARTAALMQAAGLDMLLVGDTAAEVVLGLESTREISAEFLLTLTAAVRRGAPQCFLLADLPYAWRHGTVPQVTDWTRRLYEETGSDGVKVEVTGEDAALVEAMRDAGIPVVAHMGLLPQQIEPGQGYRAHARDADGAIQLMQDARTLENAGAAMLLLEAVAGEVAGEIASRTELPVIGCVAGPHCDGTVVVVHDMLGWGGGHRPSRVKQYADLAQVFGEAFGAYVRDIQAERFPRKSDAILMKPGEYEKLTASLKAAASGRAPGQEAGGNSRSPGAGGG